MRPICSPKNFSALSHTFRMGCVNSAEATKSLRRRESSGISRSEGTSANFPGSGSTEHDTTASGRLSVCEPRPVWDLRAHKILGNPTNQNRSVASSDAASYFRHSGASIPLRRHQSSPRASVPGWSAHRAHRSTRFSPTPVTLRSNSFASGSAAGSYTSDCQSATPPSSPLCRSTSLNVSVVTRRGIIRAASLEQLNGKSVITKSFSASQFSDNSCRNPRSLRFTGDLRIRPSLQ